jgi:glycerophosphoryl diester phosphodiesterase
VAALAPFRAAGAAGSTFALGATPRATARLLATTLAGRRPPAGAAYAALCTPLRWHGLPLPVAGFARALRAQGRTVHVWTVDDPATALSLWRGGVQGIITNDPAAMARARAALVRGAAG